MEKKAKNKARIGLIIFMILLVVLGFWAGIAGEFFARYYLSNFAFFRDFYFTDTTTNGQREIIINEPKKVVVEQDLRIQQIRNDISKGTVGIYKQKSFSADALNSIFLPQDYLGQAIVLTSDGWLITTQDVLTGNSDDLVVYYQFIDYSIEKVIKDELTNIAFIKIAAQNLPVIKFANWDEVFNSQQVYVYDLYNNELNIANIQNKKYQPIASKYDLVSNSQELDKFILLNQSYAAILKAAPVINNQGEIIGLLVSKNKQYDQAIPVNYISPVISQVLKDEEIKRPYLGINYINISEVKGLTSEQRQGSESGAFIWPDLNSPAIAADSPLVDILVTGDIITSIENQKISDYKDLIDIILEYKSGQEIRFKYLHENNENEISLILQ